MAKSSAQRIDLLRVREQFGGKNSQRPISWESKTLQVPRHIVDPELRVAVEDRNASRLELISRRREELRSIEHHVSPCGSVRLSHTGIENGPQLCQWNSRPEIRTIQNWSGECGLD